MFAASTKSASKSLVNRLLQTTKSSPLQVVARQSYMSRAHPSPIPEYPINQAVQMVLEGIEERKDKRAAKWERNAEKRQAKGIKDDGPYRNQDETVELSINLNLDPRRPGQALRGSLKLPHGTGKTIKCMVFSKDASLVESAQKAGHLAGGEELVDRIINGEIALADYQRALATKDILPLLAKKCARLLGPRGIMPNSKTNTVFDEPNVLLNTLEEQSSTITYRIDANGIVHVRVGKGAFAPTKLLENVQAICNTIQEVKPEQYGKSKKSSKKMGKNVKYWLRAHLSSTQGKGVRMDLRTIDPTSPFFMRDPE